MTPKYDVLSPAFFLNPFPTFRRMQQEDPVYWDPILQGWILTKYADIPKVLRDPKFSSRRVEQYSQGAPNQEKLKEYNAFVSSWMAFSDPPDHTRLRALIAKAMTGPAVEALRQPIQEKINELIDQLRNESSGNFLEQFAEPLPIHVFSVLMGIPVEDTYRLKQDMIRIIHLFCVGVASAKDVDHAYEGMQNFKKYCYGYIQQRRHQSTDDLLSKLMEARAEGSMLTDEELVAMIIMLMIAGYETTTKLTGNAIYTLLSHPDQFQKLKHRPELLNNALEEVLRYEGPTFATFRRVIEDTEIHGHSIRKDQMVFAFILAANRDPDHFSNPDVFDIEREDSKHHLGFSTGIHICPGAHLARLEVRMALQSLITAFPNMKLETNEPQWPPHLMLRGLQELQINYQPTATS